MSIWLAEIKDLNRLYKSIDGLLPELEKELEKLIASEDENMLLVYARRCLEVIITDLCKNELQRERGTEPLQRIIDKLNKEQKVPHNIIVSMYGVNSMSTFGAHPKEFDLRQIKPVLSNLETILYWYIKYRDIKVKGKMPGETKKQAGFQPKQQKLKKRRITVLGSVLVSAVVIMLLILTDIINIDKLSMLKKIDSVAILPFDNYTGNDSLEFFVEGMHASLISDMSQLSGMRVTQKTSSKAYKNTEKSIQDISSELNVDAVIEAEVLCVGDSICVRFKLISPYPEEKLLWESDYKEEKSQILNLYNEVTKKIAEEVKISLTPEEEKTLVADKGTVHPDVLDAYYKGSYNLGFLTLEGLQTAIDYFNKALEIDPNFAPAHAALAGVWAVLKQMDFVSSDEADPKIMKHLGKARELDSTIAVVYYYQAIKEVWTDFDWPGGESSFKKALELNPNYSEARALYSHLLMLLSNWKEAREQMNIALKTDPNNPFVNVLNGMVLMCEEDYANCIGLLEPLEKIMPNNPLVILGLFVSYSKTGQVDMAIQQCKKWINPATNEKAVQILETEYEKSGFTNALNLAADEVEGSMDKTFVSPQKLFVIYALAGNTEKTLYWLERAYIKRDPDIPYIAVLSYLKPYRDEPRFIDIVKGLSLNQRN